MPHEKISKSPPPFKPVELPNKKIDDPEMVNIDGVFYAQVYHSPGFFRYYKVMNATDVDNGTFAKYPHPGLRGDKLFGF